MAIKVTARKLDEKDSKSWAVFADHRWIFAGLTRDEVADRKRKVKEMIARDPFFTYN